MINNKYINYIKKYISQNTPVDFKYDIEKYNIIFERLNSIELSDNIKDILCASYSLFYTSLNYHKLASLNETNQSYNILIGDYISSYITEQLYKNHLYEILKVFASNSKKIMLNYLNNSTDDNLLEDIISTLSK